ncbi:anchored repeat-type ABC transporter permease subunit [Corynebacterium aquilae]|uniref:anchored repeat-type ABC transporter permease subunit n=1 Tax=Corynebacterium aquilae TaxID=203263 RepID=UPI0009531A06|nr:anchored repeat-type ABC transporter permease subunit [Corynebacterium aquilae]
MITPIDFLADLANPQLAFLPQALLVAVLSAILCGIVGTLVVLRGMAFIGDAVAHAVFPGLAIAFITGGSLLLGGAAAGISVAIIIAIVAHRKAVAHDSAIGIFFAAAFAIGLVILAKTPTYTANVTSFLFGSITGVSPTDILVTAAALIITIATLLIFGRLIIAVSLDRETSAALGIPVLLVDMVLYTIIATTVVVSVRTVGNILVLALLVTPAATARILHKRLIPMMLSAAAIGSFSALVGLYLSWALDIPTGATIVLVATAIFLLAWAAGPLITTLARTKRTPTTRSPQAHTDHSRTQPAADSEQPHPDPGTEAPQPTTRYPAHTQAVERQHA